MASAVADTDLRRVLDVIDAGSHAPPMPGRLPHEALAALAALLPADSIAFADMDVATCTHYAEDYLEGATTTFLPSPATEPDHPFWKHYPDSLLCSYPTRTGDDRTVTLRSDFYSTREWIRTPMYADVIRGSGLNFELMCCLPGAGVRSRRLLFFRSGSRDFSERDRFVMALLRPHLAEMLGNRRPVVGAPILTVRQVELMRLVAAGYTNAEIAVALYLSPHTVRKHLENIFDRLGVTSRTAAVARAFPG